MARQVVILDSDFQRLKASQLLGKAPLGWRMELKAPTRSLQANALLWARLTDISEQLIWHGLKLSPEDWKDVLSAGLKREVRTVPNIDGDGFVMLGMRTSDMTAAEFAQLLDLVEAFAAQNGVTLSEHIAA